MLKKLMFASVLFAQALSAGANEAYPSKPIKFVVPYPPGGPTDAMARLIQGPLQAKLNTPVIIDNRGGAGGNLGSDFVAKSPGDGYTILLAASGPMSVNKTLYKSLPFDPEKDFAPIIQISEFPLVLEVHPSVPASNLKQFLALAKERPGELSFASAGNGTPQHLAGELFNSATKMKLQHIPYKGAGPALNDVVGGHVKVMYDILGSSVQHIKAGKLRPLAVTTAARSPALPDVPTLAEAGLPGYTFSAWHGIVAPAATPKPIVARLNQAINEIFADPAFKKRWEELGTPIVGGTPENFGALMRSESSKLGKLVRDTGVTLD
ncbi:Bug family tripartite tricarboxylate transporter substrate binding protein [Noviherbaspirillum aerium]|uniref:Bug family tripartite tricarboxylate transporter substrate binding protein n=1 Tax=Noviherbaspirillum aerium TaxID=2588497 RepID=UPI00124BF4BA|nr:tripartite tricarboxylate transporter substrate binding protein [Noviherbaspirillum aerium]